MDDLGHSSSDANLPIGFLDASSRTAVEVNYRCAGR